MTLKKCTLLSVVFLTLTFIAFSIRSTENPQYLIGQGMADITGPVAEVGMMGYAALLQKTHGIHTRLWARAFVISDTKHDKLVAYVTADLCMIFQAVKREVVRSLQDQLGDVFNDKNVMLTATHTHSAPGGFSEHGLYNFTIGGLYGPHFDLIVRGITQAIVEAYLRLKPGTLKIAYGDLLGAQTNRSPAAYQNNPLFEKLQHLYDFDPEMFLLRAEDTAGHEMGEINWFPVHATSLGNSNELISGDNKGLAAHFFEKSKGTRYDRLGANPFVAIFAQTTEGDVSPNNYGPEGSFGKLDDDFTALQDSAEKQYRFAKKLYDRAETVLSGPIDYQHYYSSFKEVAVGEDHKTCAPALGWAFAAGAEDGPSNIPGFSEGMIWNGPWLSESAACQAEKFILSYIGYGGLLSSPEILPIQIIRIGELAIVGVPFEVTTMAGRRIQLSIQSILRQAGIQYTLVASLANAYAGYLTTREEYAMQHYEGASNHFGPWSLMATQQKANQLARALLTKTEVVDEATPPDLSHTASHLFLPIVLDAPPFFFMAIGNISVEAKDRYRTGETVRVRFWAGHPNNSLGLLKSFVDIVNVDTGEVVAHDWDPEVIYRWDRFGIASSQVTVQWHIPEEMPIGKYYIVHRGHANTFGSVYPYEGHSRAFWVF